MGGARLVARFARQLMAAFAFVVLAGCEAVYTPQPLGDEAVTLDPAEWQGTWLAPDMVITTTVLDGAAGRLQAAWIERGTAGATLEIVEGSVRASGDWTFANILDETESEPPAEAPGGAEPAAEGAAQVAGQGIGPRYVWLRVEKGENHLTLWSPNVEQFKILVGDGRLPGRVTDDGVELGELTPEQLRMINDPASNLLNWADPAVFVRIAE
jgi:hypothetical protein